MNELKLKEYFENTISVNDFASDVKESQKKTGFDTSAVFINQSEELEGFKITREHLVKLCDDVLNGHLLTIDLNTIAFAIVCSDYFYIDKDLDNNEIIENVINDWDNPDLGYDLSLKNIALWKYYLISGKNKFDKNELKTKFRGIKNK